MSVINRSLLVLVFIIALTNCVALQSFPNIVRAGDTVTLAVGSVDGLDRSNITVTYFADSDPGVGIPLTANVRSVFRIYPDKTSLSYWRNDSPTSSMSTVPSWSGHGPWQSVVAVDTPIDLPSGTGYVKVSFGSGVIIPNNSTSVENINIAMEVLAALDSSPLVGGPHTFEYKAATFETSVIGDLVELEFAKQAVVRTVKLSGAYFATGGNIAVSAAEYILNIPVLDNTGTDISDLVGDSAVRVVLDDKREYLTNQVNLNWSRNGSQIKVIITSPALSQILSRIRFSVIVRDNISDVYLQATISDSISILSTRYFNENGDEIFGVTLPEIVIQGSETIKYVG